jgi:hypothetical protein
VIDIVEALSIFSGWPPEVQQACVYCLQNRRKSEWRTVERWKPNANGQPNGQTKREVAGFSVDVVPRKKRKRKRKSPSKSNAGRSNKPWDKWELDELTAHWDQHGWNIDDGHEFAKVFDRTVVAVRAQFDRYQKDKQNGRAQEVQK